MRHPGLCLLYLCALLMAAGDPVSAPAGLRLHKTLDLQRTTRQPRELAVDSRFIYVADRTGGLNKYDREGTLITSLERINNVFFIASDLAVDNEYLYLPDEISKSIIKIAKRLDLSSASVLPLPGLELINPAGIYVDTNQDIYLSDRAQDQVYCLNALGLLEWRKGMFGEGGQSLNSPRIHFRARVPCDS